MIVGYARVSTDGQTLDAQQAELRSAGVEKVYSEKISGAITDRPALAKAINAPGNGDALIVTKLDRLARSTRDLLNTLAEITQRGASFKSLGDAWADTTTGRQANADGPRRTCGIRASLDPGQDKRGQTTSAATRGKVWAQAQAHCTQEALARRAAGEALVDIARSYAVSHSTISRL